MATKANIPLDHPHFTNKILDPEEKTEVPAVTQESTVYPCKRDLTVGAISQQT
jgi:hypothetical protein